MRLRLFCKHTYKPSSVSRGENLFGETYAVDFLCIRCLKIKRDIGYTSDEAARRALYKYHNLMNQGG